MTPLAQPWRYRRLRLSFEIADDRHRDDILSSPEKVVEFCNGLAWSTQEVFLWIGLDTAKRVIAVDEMFKGTVDACMVHPREVFRSVLLLAPTVTCIILVHNHPSGDPLPSPADEQFFESVDQAAVLLRIPVIDCVIVSQRGAWSRAGGLLRVPERYQRSLLEESEVMPS